MNYNNNSRSSSYNNINEINNYNQNHYQQRQDGENENKNENKNEDQYEKEEEEEDDLTVHKYIFNFIGRNDLCLIIDQDQDNAMNTISNIIRSFASYNVGEIFTEDPERYKKFVFSDCESLTPQDMFMCRKETLADIYGRQSGHFDCEIKLNRQHLEILSRLDAPSQKRYKDDLKPVHFLPKKMVGQNFPDDIRAHLNKFLIVPDAFLAIHHPKSNTQKFWNIKEIKDLVEHTTANNTILKIFSCADPKIFPPKFYDNAQIIFLFTDDENQIKDIYKKLKLKNLWGQEEFVDVVKGIRAQDPEWGLVIKRKTLLKENAVVGQNSQIKKTNLFYTNNISPHSKRPIIIN